MNRDFIGPSHHPVRRGVAYPIRGNAGQMNPNTGGKAITTIAAHTA